MSQSAEAAEQIVNAATNATIKGVECISNLAGKGALSLTTFLLAVIKEEKKTKGKARMRVFNGKPTKVFVIKAKDMKTFAEEAKKYGVLYAAVFNKHQPDGLVDVVVNAADAAKVNRIAERFALSTVDVEKIREEIQKSREQREQKQEASKESGDVPSADRKPEKLELKFQYPEEKVPEAPNPTQTETMSPSPFAPIFASPSNSKAADPDRPSVKEQIRQMRKERSAAAAEKQQTRGKTKTKQQTKSKPKANKGR